MSLEHPTSLEDLEFYGVRFVRVTWVDFANFIRYRVVPIAHIRKLVAGGDKSGGKSRTIDGRTNVNANEITKVNPHGGIQLAKVSLGLVYLSVADGFPVVSEYLYALDLTSARLLPYAPGHASVLGWFEEKEVPNDATTFEVELCPRTLLRRIVEEAKRTDGVEFLIGFETEVIFLKSVDPVEAVNDYGWSETGAICAGSAEARALEEIADALESAGIELQMYHAEAAPGQFEIVTGPLPPLEACDALIATREIIMNFAAKHGMRATLAPRVFSNSCGSAAHTHISLSSSTWSSSTPPPNTPNSGMSALEGAFLAGLLAHLPAVTAFTLPTRPSYARMVDGLWSGGTWVSWGRDNREAPVRLCGRSAADVHFEVKSVDGTASPHLAAAALLAAGMAGVRAKEALRVRGLDAPASTLSGTERQEAGVTARMPLAIDEARAALKKDEVLKGALGEGFVRSYLSVNKTLDEQLAAPTPEEAMIKLIKTY